MFLVVFVNVTLVPDVYAGDDFAAEYRSYQSAVRAGKAAFNKKDYQKAITHYSRAIELSPFEVSFYNDRGVSYFKSGKYKEAVGDFDKVLVMDSRRYSAYVYRGLCYEKSGNYIGALKDYTSALGMNPKDASVNNNLAWLYATSKNAQIQDKAKALEHAKKAAEISNYRQAEILDTLALVYFINGIMKEAVEAEQKAVKLEPGNEGFKKKLEKYEGAM